MALTILLQLNRDDARLFSTERLREHQFFSLICMHCNKKVGDISHRLHPPLQKILRTPLMIIYMIIYIYIYMIILYQAISSEDEQQ